MLEIKFLVADRLPAASDVQAALARLAGAGWRAALLSARMALLECASIRDRFAAAAALLPAAPAPAPVAGDLLFRGDELFYVLTKPRGRHAWLPAAAQQAGLDNATPPEFEIGVISPHRPSLDSRLAAFGAAFTEALRLGGTAATFAWRAPAASRLEHWRAGGEWQSPRLSLTALDRVEATAQPSLRDLLEKIQRATFLRETDLMAETAPEQLRADLARLQALGLIASELLASCRVTARPLLRLETPQQQQREEVRRMQCPDCGASLSDEPITTIYLPAPNVDAANFSRDWLKIWLTERLNRLGVAALLWRRDDPELEPVSLLAAEFAGQTWCLALTPLAIEATAAHAIQRLRQRFGLERLVVIALGGVARAARFTFERPLPLFPTPLQAPIFLDELEPAEQVLQSALHEAALHYAAQRLRPLEEVSGYPLEAVLRALYSGRRAASSGSSPE